MKKLLFLSIFAFFALVSANVFGQGSGTAPSIGSVHQYYVNGTFNTPTSGAASTYTWWISTNPANLLARTASTTDFAITTNGSPYDSPTVGSLKGTGIEIKWNSTASTTSPYYLVVQEVGTATLCTNIKAVAITPTNNFKLRFEAIASNGTDLTDNPSRCPANISLTASGTNITYNYGGDNFMFKLTASDLFSNWSFVGTFVNGLAGTNTLEYQIGGTSSSGWLTYTSASTLNVPANVSGNEVVYFRATTVNGSVEQNLATKTITLELSQVKDAGGNAVTVITNNANATMSTPIQTQTIQARPNTSTISSN